MWYGRRGLKAKVNFLPTPHRLEEVQDNGQEAVSVLGWSVRRALHKSFEVHHTHLPVLRIRFHELAMQVGEEREEGLGN